MKTDKRIKTDAAAKVTVTPPTTRAGMEACLGTVADLKLAEIAFTSEMDADIQAVKDRHAGRLLEIRGRLEAYTVALQAWAEKHSEEFGKLKSIETPSGKLGFRTGMPKLKTLAKWTWDRVLERLLTAAPQYVRTKQEVDKEGIIACCLPPTEMAGFGVQVVQDESFYVEPNLTKVEHRETVASN